MPGPQKRPSALNEIMGNPGRRKPNEAEPIVPEGDVIAPDFLSDGALAIWKQYAPIAIQMGVLTSADVIAFASMCTSLATYIELYNDVQENGLTEIVGKECIRKLRPEANYMNTQLAYALKMLDRFGMNPSNRVNIKIPGLDRNKAKPSKPPILRVINNK